MKTSKIWIHYCWKSKRLNHFMKIYFSKHSQSLTIMTQKKWKNLKTVIQMLQINVVFHEFHLLTLKIQTQSLGHDFKRVSQEMFPILHYSSISLYCSLYLDKMHLSCHVLHFQSQPLYTLKEKIEEAKRILVIWPLACPFPWRWQKRIIDLRKIYYAHKKKIQLWIVLTFSKP